MLSSALEHLVKGIVDHPDDVRIEVAAEVVRLTDGLVELRLAAVPHEPIVASFSLGEAAPRRRAEVNPDVVD